jgi:tRNA dimethylallyltransferase
VAEPDQPFTAGEYSRRAGGAAGDCRAGPAAHCDRRNGALSARAHRRALCRAGAADELRARLNSARNRHTEDWLHRLLKRLDPASAARIHANDTPKLIRAIEVCLAARKPLSEALAAIRSPAFACCGSA